MDPEDFDLIGVDIAEPWFGAQIGKGVLRTHGTSSCAGPLGENGKPICCVHNPSKHHMLEWPQNWRSDKGMMERLCPHGVGHPDPDDLKVRTTTWAGTHGCDGCCFKPEPERGATITVSSACPDDTNGDGDCGKKLCPYCGPYSGPRYRAL